MLLYMALVFGVLSFLVSFLLYVRKEVPTYLKFFPVFLLITVIVEIIGFQLKEKGSAGMPKLQRTKWQSVEILLIKTKCY